MRLVVDLLACGKKVVVPTNSYSEANTLLSCINDAFVSSQSKPNVYLIDRDTVKEKPINTNEWIQYDCLIYTPSIVAGVSFDKEHFDTLVGLFRQQSTNVELSFQMLCRVRKLKDKHMTLVLPTDAPGYIDTSRDFLH